MATPIPGNCARFTLDEVVSATGGRIGSALTRERWTREAVSVTSDSRAVTPASIFVALVGEAHDGHAFVPAAVKAGAAIVVVRSGTELGDAGDAMVVETADTLAAWGALAGAHLARWRRGGERRRVVAITGSAGKTTTKELTAALLGEVAKAHFTAGNLNNRIGVPAVVLALEDEPYCVLEMGMSLPGELDAICGFARPDVSIVVNVGVAHSEGVGGKGGVMREKGAVYRALGPTGIAIVNADDPYVVRAAADAGVARIVTFGRTASAAYRLAERTPTPAGSRLRVIVAADAPFGPRELTIELGLPGEAAAIDFTAALAAEEAASGTLLTPPQIIHALERVELVGRGAVLRLGDVVVIDDTYNANPASMRASLATLGELAGEGRRRVAVLGEMKELGRLAEDEHRALGDALALAKVELAIGCGGLVSLALERARTRAQEPGLEIVDAPDVAAAAAAAVRLVRPGDVVLVKGSRSVQAERVVSALTERFAVIA